MKENRNLPIILACLFFATFILLSITTVNATRAALNEKAENNDVTMTLNYIGVSLEECTDGNNYSQISYKTWSGDNWSEGGSGKLSSDKLGALKSGVKDYRIRVSANEVSTINEYVRVVVRKYWTKTGANGASEKDFSLNPNFINIVFNTETNDKGTWILDPSYSKNSECKILYYDTPIGPEGNEEKFAQVTSDVIKGIGLNDTAKDAKENTVSIKDYYKKTVTKEDNKTITTYEYLYDGKSFVIEIEADAVQVHNAVPAIKSAWGIDVTKTGDKISLG